MDYMWFLFVSSPAWRDMWDRSQGACPNSLCGRPCSSAWAPSTGDTVSFSEHRQDCPYLNLDQNPRLKAYLSHVVTELRGGRLCTVKLSHGIRSAVEFIYCKRSLPFRLPVFFSSAPQGYFITVYNGSCVYFHLSTVP